MTDIVFDTEFNETGTIIDLISIGMINRTTGAELYLINADADWDAIKRLDDPFICRNVIPHLPLSRPVTYDPATRTFDFQVDRLDPRVVGKDLIAFDVRDFILGAADPRLWAWYGAYDMVALNQLWGRMVDKPAGIPWHCWDFKVEQERNGISDEDLPPQESGEHDALADARTLLARMEWLERQAAAR